MPFDLDGVNIVRNVFENMKWMNAIYKYRTQTDIIEMLSAALCVCRKIALTATTCELTHLKMSNGNVTSTSLDVENKIECLTRRSEIHVTFEHAILFVSINHFACIALHSVLCQRRLMWIIIHQNQLGTFTPNAIQVWKYDIRRSLFLIMSPPICAIVGVGAKSRFHFNVDDGVMAKILARIQCRHQSIMQHKTQMQWQK